MPAERAARASPVATASSRSRSAATTESWWSPSTSCRRFACLTNRRAFAPRLGIASSAAYRARLTLIRSLCSSWSSGSEPSRRRALRRPRNSAAAIALGLTALPASGGRPDRAPAARAAGCSAGLAARPASVRARPHAGWPAPRAPAQMPGRRPARAPPPRPRDARAARPDPAPLPAPRPASAARRAVRQPTRGRSSAAPRAAARAAGARPPECWCELLGVGARPHPGIVREDGVVLDLQSIAASCRRGDALGSTRGGSDSASPRRRQQLGLLVAVHRPGLSATPPDPLEIAFAALDQIDLDLVERAAPTSSPARTTIWSTVTSATTPTAPLHPHAAPHGVQRSHLGRHPVAQRGGDQVTEATRHAVRRARELELDRRAVRGQPQVPGAVAALAAVAQGDPDRGEPVVGRSWYVDE